MAGQSKPASLSPWGKAIAGSVAAMGANLLVYPLDLAKTRLQVQTKADSGKQQYKGTIDVIQQVYAQGGFKALYAGLSGTLLGVASTNFAYFYWYSVVRGSYVKRRGTQDLTTAAELSLGAIAGALAQLFTIPVAVVTTRQQTSDDDDSLLQCATKVIKEDGPRGLWRGLKASLILVINPSITYGSSSRLRSLLFGDKQHLTVANNFLLGALSKSMATIATQPMIVAKVMQQSSERFKGFTDALAYMIQTDGLAGLFKGIGPQLSKGILVQGILLAMKDRVEFWMLLLLRALAKKRVALA